MIWIDIFRKIDLSVVKGERMIPAKRLSRVTSKGSRHTEKTHRLHRVHKDLCEEVALVFELEGVSQAHASARYEDCSHCKRSVKGQFCILTWLMALVEQNVPTSSAGRKRIASNVGLSSMPFDFSILSRIILQALTLWAMTSDWDCEGFTSYPYSYLMRAPPT